MNVESCFCEFFLGRVTIIGISFAKVLHLQADRIVAASGSGFILETRKNGLPDLRLEARCTFPSAGGDASVLTQAFAVNNKYLAPPL
jgi:hypothetical protein